MESKEQLDQLLVYIKSISKLMEQIYEREIYPVSFFSQAFDITHKIQELLHQIEVSQIELFERQMKEHQAQILSVGRLSGKTSAPVEPVTPLVQQKQPTPPPPPAKTESQEIKPVAPPTSPAKEQVTMKISVTQAAPVDPATLVRRETPSPPLSARLVPEKAENSLNDSIEKHKLSDLRKAFTLNDRFRFCRELFSRDENRMNRTIVELNGKDSFDASVAYLKEQFDWDFEDATVSEFIAVLEKRFS
ncbi:MAG: hypothetical protein LBT78_10035 [Tannerella sp.]|jgi:hypothetical protein|nr:hypothetical protein [Tannerella sp.]